MGDPCPGPHNPSVAASPHEAPVDEAWRRWRHEQEAGYPQCFAKFLQSMPHPREQAASPKDAEQAASPKDEVYDLFVKLVDQLPPLIQRQFPKKEVTEKIPYAGLPCPHKNCYGQMHTLPGIWILAGLNITTQQNVSNGTDLFVSEYDFMFSGFSLREALPPQIWPPLSEPLASQNIFS